MHFWTPRKWRLRNSCLSMGSFVCFYVSNQLFSRSVSYFLNFCTSTEIKKQRKKVTEAGSPEKYLFALRWAKKVHSWPKIKFVLSFHKILSLLLLKVSKIERCYNSLFSCAKNTSGLQFIRQNSLTLIQSDCGIFLSSISLEVMRQCNFLHGDTHQRKVALETITFG